jgi:3,4-dihydroxy 2-butanone 4-phosphate synthase/GTP cyclohydrolase II
LKDLGIRQMKLLANPSRLPTMSGYDLEVTGHMPYQSQSNG